MSGFFRFSRYSALALVCLSVLATFEVSAQSGRYITSTTSVNDFDPTEVGLHRININFKVSPHKDDVHNVGFKKVEGTATLLQTDGSGKRVQGKISGSIDPLRGPKIKMKFVDRKGITRSYSLEVEYDSTEDKFYIRLPRKFGNFHDAVAESKSPKTADPNDMSGTYSFSAAGPMMIVKLSNGEYQGTYSGIASAGHGGLRGTLIGKLVNGTWGGTIAIREGSVAVDGTFFLNFNSSPPATLIGSLFLPGENNVSLTRK